VPVPLPLPAAFGGKIGYIDHLRRMMESAGVRAAFCPAMLEKWLAEAAAGLGLKLGGTLALLTDVEPVASELPAQNADGHAYLQFSSGSTRFPLGVAVTQRAFMANAHYTGRYGLELVEGDRAVSWLPFYHDMGLVGFLLIPMACQVTVDLIATRDFARRPLMWLDLIGRNRATLSFSPSFGYELCVRRAEAASTNGLDLSSWRSAGIGGDMIRASVLSQFTARFAPCGFSSRSFMPSYGMAEATLALSFNPIGKGPQHDIIDWSRLEREQQALPARDEEAHARVLVLCGRMLPDHDIEVRDGAGRILGDRKVGRIFVRGPSLMDGYFGAPEETARVMGKDGWMDTGDLGYLIEGQVVITGRAKDLIIVKGRNLWPQDLEWAAEAELPLLRSGDVAVFSVEDAVDETVVILAQCRLRDPEARDALVKQIVNIFRGRHGIEAKVVLVPPHSLPRTSSGKLSRSRARAMYLSGEFEVTAPSALTDTATI
jgi:fatty-acyl-CoA synthase